MPQSKDLFDDSTMTFGEHLEVLRVHLIKALFGLAICVVFWLYKADWAIDVIRRPLDDALAEYGKTVSEEEERILGEASFFGKDGADEPGVEEDGAKDDAKSDADADPEAKPANDDPDAKSDDGEEEKPVESTIVVKVPVKDVAGMLNELDAERFNPPADDEDRVAELHLTSEAFAGFEKHLEDRLLRATRPRPVTLTVQEAFMTYVKVAIITGLMTASPWIFYQMWLFVAAGLYPHERKYVYTYLPISIGLFFAGAVLCYFGVLPLVLDFLFAFNRSMAVEPNMQLTKWINFAIVLPLMFGVSFQLPLVMLFLERISIFSVDAYQKNRRMSILVIAILSMLLTPSDPASMLMMMFPLIFLYELGIVMCKLSPAKTPFEGAEPV